MFVGENNAGENFLKKVFPRTPFQKLFGQGNIVGVDVLDGPKEITVIFSHLGVENSSNFRSVEGASSYGYGGNLKALLMWERNCLGHYKLL